ncbi:hypothetical protein ABPG74_008759 [Tetrahymena malaccensis]
MAYRKKSQQFNTIKNAYEDYDKKQINRESKLYSGKSTKNTALESRIIQFMKNNINIKKKKDSVKLLQSQSIISKTNSEIPQKSKSIDCSSKISVDGIKQAEYYTIIQSEQQKPDVYKIRMSYFLNEGYHQCYIIFDQQSEEDVIKNVIDSKKKIELRFVNVYYKELIETKIQKIEYLESQEDSIYKSNKLIKQQELNHTFTQNTESSPRKLVQKNKSNEHFLNTESIFLKDQSLLMHKSNSKTNQFDNTMNQTSESPIQYQKSPQNNSTNHKNTLKTQNLKIKFKLFEGENTKSNVLKISVSDKSGGINPESLLQILKDMSFQKYNKNLENFVYQNLGWKISMHNIGLIGPYADFFISPNILNGLKISFYIYTDINVVFQSNNRIVFSNQQFFDDYKRLKSTYYNKDSKQLIKNFSIKHQDYLEEDQLKLPK